MAKESLAAVVAMGRVAQAVAAMGGEASVVVVMDEVAMAKEGAVMVLARAVGAAAEDYRRAQQEEHKVRAEAASEVVVMAEAAAMEMGEARVVMEAEEMVRVRVAEWLEVGAMVAAALGVAVLVVAE